MHKAFKFRLSPTKQQEILLAKHFGCCRIVYNHFLKERIEAYDEDKTTLNYYDNNKALTLLKKQEDFAYLNEVSAVALQQSLKNLDDAYKKFFREHQGKPKRKKWSPRQSFRISDPNKVRIEGKRIVIPKFREGIKINLHRELEGKIKNVTISKNPAGQYHAAIVVETEIAKLPEVHKKIGIDVGIKDFCTCSDRIVIPNPRYLEKSQKRLAKLQRDYDRKKKYSGKEEHKNNNILQGKNKEKARIKLAKLSQKVANQRKDFIHKLSTKIIRENQSIALEDLSIEDMKKDPRFAKSVSDASWFDFRIKVQYKGEWYGREIVLADRYFPSSQLCSNCNHQNKDVKDLDLREWTCPKCNVEHDRDINASINLENLIP